MSRSTLLNRIRHILKREEPGIEDNGSATPGMFTSVKNFSDNYRKHKYPELLANEISNQVIFKYINNNNHEGLLRFIESRSVNVDEYNQEGQTCLHLAAEKGYIESVTLLLDHGANIHCEDFDKCAPLHLASRNDQRLVVEELLNRGGALDILDSGTWTPLIWACYEGHLTIVDILISRGANIHVKDIYHITGLNWAAGRGHHEIVKLLLDNKAAVDVRDKYGTTALIWASRNGYSDIVSLLLLHGASVNEVGMHSWTSLLVAVEKNHLAVVDLLLEKQPNVNAFNNEGQTSLSIASKHGFTEIALRLCSKGAYVNLPDKFGDSNLIHAAKGGHKVIVDCLLKKYADVNFKGRDSKTCLHWAIDKNHTEIVKMILNSNPDLETRTIEGDTPLLRAVRARNSTVIEYLLRKKAKLGAADNKGDTALHIGMRARSKALIEILLRNPKNSHLLYRRNKKGETPYSIDVNSPGNILGQIFGPRKLNTYEDSENILGYDIYSSSLADILTEPSLSMPITIGLFAKWGSGKSFLLQLLRNEMKNFIRHWINPSFITSPILFFLILHISLLFGVLSLILVSNTSSYAYYSGVIALGSSMLILLLSYLFVFLLHQGSHKFNWMFLNTKLSQKLNSLKLICQVLFCHPPGPLHKSSKSTIPPLRLLFTDQTKVGTYSEGINSVIQMIGSLYDSIEMEYGKLTTRLFRALRPKYQKLESPQGWRKFCCIPTLLVYNTTLICILCSIVLWVYFPNYSIHEHMFSSLTEIHINNYTTLQYPHTNREILLGKTKNKSDEKNVILGFIITLYIISSTFLLLNVYSICRILKAVFFSQRQHLQQCLDKRSEISSEGIYQSLKKEVTLLLDMVESLDAFSEQKTRMVVIIDGLDACEQNKVLCVLDAVQMLFSDVGSPFIIIIALDPHLISKAIESNSTTGFSETFCGGNAYLRNIVHLPFFLQNTGLRKIKISQQMSVEFHLNGNNMRRHTMTDIATPGSLLIRDNRKNFSPSSSFKSPLNSSVEEHPQDLTKMLLTDDYFNDVNPKSLRRLMNVIYVMGRLLKAFRIDFNWYHLSLWVNITEQWPYRTSWIIYFCEENDWKQQDVNTPLYFIYNKIKNVIPTSRDAEPLLEWDRDEKKMESFLNYHVKDLSLRDVKMFLPFSINLDPYILKMIRDKIAEYEENGMNSIQSFSLENKTISGYTGLQNVSKSKTNPFISETLFPLSSKPSQSFVYPPYNSSILSNDVSKNNEGFSNDNKFSSVKWSKQRVLPNSVDEVCLFLREIPKLTPSKLDDYCSIIISENLIGSVLLTSDLNDLKKVLNMNFGDWELFCQTLNKFRRIEKNYVHLSLDDTSSSKAEHKNKKSLEKQVTMEEAMISGILSTLNQEANLDIQERYKSVSCSNSREDMEVLYIAHSSPSLVKAEDVEVGRRGRRISSILQISPNQSPIS